VLIASWVTFSSVMRDSVALNRPWRYRPCGPFSNTSFGKSWATARGIAGKLLVRLDRLPECCARFSHKQFAITSKPRRARLPIPLGYSRKISGGDKPNSSRPRGSGLVLQVRPKRVNNSHPAKVAAPQFSAASACTWIAFQKIPCHRLPLQTGAINNQPIGGQAPKNIPLISNNLHNFAKIFFSRRRPFYRLNNLNFYRNLLCPNNLPPNAFLLPASPIYGEMNFLPRRPPPPKIENQKSK
jgi:hypothetical protein